MNIELITNINEYLNIIHKTKYFDNNWYRGHCYSSYRLEPSLYRNKKEVITGDKYMQFRHYELEDENLAIREFKKQLNGKYKGQKLSDIDYLYLMQHNGIETRLLDFTTNPLIALFFSVVEKKTSNIEREENDSLWEFSEEYSSVFCMNPKKINEISFGQNKVIDLSYVKFSKIQNLLTPICVEPSNPEIDNRLNIQNGKFVLFGKDVNPLDWYDVPSKTMLKIMIPNSKRERILYNLDKKFNINYTAIYPDMEGIKLQVKNKVMNKYKKL